jgi:VWFA-related protein
MHKWLFFSLTISLMPGSFGQTMAPAHYSRMVTVPALVEEKSGQIAYDLSATDFSIKDGGIEQHVQLEDNANPPPLSLLLVIQTGGKGAPQLGKIARLNDLLDSILTGPRDQVAILTFDSRLSVIQGFSTDSDAISHSLASIAPGNTGAALFDALHRAITLFDKTALENRRVILLISGENDHGSTASDATSLIRDVSSDNISVYSLTFAAPKKALLNKLWSINPLALTASAMQKNAAEALAQLTGGDFSRFDTERSFEDRTTEMANHIHNRYYLVFQPLDPEPGFHSLQVDVHRSKTNVVSARSGYWFSTADNSGSSGAAR